MLVYFRYQVGGANVDKSAGRKGNEPTDIDPGRQTVGYETTYQECKTGEDIEQKCPSF